LLIAGLVGLLYMNLINLSRGWIRGGQMDFGIGLWLVHAVFASLMAWMLWRKLRVKAPRKTAAAAS
jgi:lipopolysaccharide export system permease protein